MEVTTEMKRSPATNPKMPQPFTSGSDAAASTVESALRADVFCLLDRDLLERLRCLVAAGAPRVRSTAIEKTRGAALYSQPPRQRWN
jgi:hypothetical protein